MKRQHVDMSTNDELVNSTAAKRTAEIELANVTKGQEEIHQLLHPASLLRLDLDSMSEVLAHVDLVGLISLCQSSSFGVASVFMSCIHEIHFHPYMPSTTLQADDAAIRLLLTMIGGGHFSKLKSLVLNVGCIDLLASDHSGLRLHEFPPSLTRLHLTDVPVELGRYYRSARLSNLTSLTSLTLNMVKFVTNEDHAHDQVQAIIRILAVPTQLLEFNCVFYAGTYVRDQALITQALPTTLESLTIDQSVLGHIEHWPPHLTNLHIHFLPHWRGDVYNKPSYLIPASVTRLKLQPQSVGAHLAILDCFKSGFYLANPSTLQHLSFKYTTNTIVYAMQSVSTLTSLKSLKVKPIFDSDFHLDVTMLPKSLRWLNQGGYISSSHWQHLPPNIQLACPTRMIATPICIETSDSDEQFRFLPKSLKHVTVFNRPLPVSLPSLEHVIFSLSRACIPIPPRSECELYLAGLPKMLRSLSVSCDRCNNMFWLHNNGTDASQFELQFPCLTKFDLTLSLYESGIKDGAVQKWFRHLPKTLYSVMLRLTYPKDFSERVTRKTSSVPRFDLIEIQLPPFLEVLTIDVKPAVIGFPESLPNTFRRLTLKLADMINTEAFCTLLKSKGLHLEVHVRDVVCFTPKAVKVALTPQTIQIWHLPC